MTTTNFSSPSIYTIALDEVARKEMVLDSCVKLIVMMRCLFNKYDPGSRITDRLRLRYNLSWNFINKYPWKVKHGS